MFNHHYYKRKYLSWLPVISLGSKTLQKGYTFEGKNLLREEFVPIAKRGNNENDRIAFPEIIITIHNNMLSDNNLFPFRYFQYGFPYPA